MNKTNANELKSPEQSKFDFKDFFLLGLLENVTIFDLASLTLVFSAGLMFDAWYQPRLRGREEDQPRGGGGEVQTDGYPGGWMMMMLKMRMMERIRMMMMMMMRMMMMRVAQVGQGGWGEVRVPGWAAREGLVTQAPRGRTPSHSGSSSS